MRPPVWVLMSAVLTVYVYVLVQGGEFVRVYESLCVVYLYVYEC